MGGSVLGPHRHKRIVFLGKFGGTRFGRLEKFGRKKKQSQKMRKIGRGKIVFGPHKRKRIAVLVELWNHAQISANQIRPKVKAYLRD